MKLIFIEKIIKSNKIIKLSHYSLDISESKLIEMYSIDYFIKKNKELKRSLSRKLDNLLKNENYSLPENLKKYAIFEHLLNSYIESLEEEIVLKNESKINYKTIIIEEQKILSSLDLEELNNLIQKIIKNKKDYLVEIEVNLDNNKISVKSSEIEEKKKN
ncbi:MAG: hypothetical protein ABGW69_01975 [Nanoarchaeota archaeon]